jgi:hypothetical protein
MSSIIKVDTVQDTDGNNIINENANTITIGASGDTISIPSGATITNSGTASGFGDNLEWQSSIVTAATITVVANRGYWLDTSSNAITVTLPAAAAVGDHIILTDYARNWATNAVTINPNSLKFQGNTTPQPVYDTNGESVNIVYSGTTKGWIPNTDGAVALETPQSYSADFLVIAGGGGASGGAGGAGGYRTSTQTLNGGTVYTITVGDGGAGGGATSSKGTNGSDSSISGSGLTTITSAGGGGGGRIDSASMSDNTGLDGGSGGGSGRGISLTNSGFGSGNTPATTPSQGNNGGAVTGLAPYYGAGGGGGAGGVGAAGTGSGGGAGGAGTASSITGSSVTRAGGGGGAANNTTAGTGGSGGGGNGVAGGGTGADGTANTGGGAGGSDGSGGSGGKGVIIISVPDASYSGTTTGSPTVATGVSGKTIMTFTGTGSYTG